MKHKGDTIPEGAKEISKEEFNEGVKRIAQHGNFADKFMDIPDEEGKNPVDGAMNPPESGKRTRRSQTQEQKQEQKQPESAPGQSAEQDAGTRTRRTRRTR